MWIWKEEEALRFLIVDEHLSLEHHDIGVKNRRISKLIPLIYQIRDNLCSTSLRQIFLLWYAPLWLIVLLFGRIVSEQYFKGLGCLWREWWKLYICTLALDLNFLARYSYGWIYWMIITSKTYVVIISVQGPHHGKRLFLLYFPLSY